MKYNFLKQLGDIINSNQSRTIAITGNINDLFFENRENNSGTYVPIIDFLIRKWSSSGRIILFTDNKGCINFSNNDDKKIIDQYWLSWRTGKGNSKSKSFSDFLSECNGNSSACFELLRQLCLCSREVFDFKHNIIIFIQNADLYLPESGEWSRLSDADRKRTSTCLEWFSDSEFTKGQNTVILTAESKFQINNIISSLPQILEVSIPSPNYDERKFFIDWYQNNINKDLKISGTKEDLARLTAGLGIHSLNQLLTASCYENSPVNLQDIVPKVEEFIKSQIGEDTVEFKKPSNKIDDLIGFKDLKKYLREKFIPRIKSSGEDTLSGAAISGSIGCGKTFCFEAVAGELDMPVLVLKNLRSQWYGQTDVIIDRLKRTLEALGKVLIFVDEADTQFGGVGSDVHETERRLTGKIQQMMSDTKLKGKIIWLLMTARIHQLSPDIRRPGRVGDLIIPIFDPEGEDHTDFVIWMVKKCCDLKNVNTNKIAEKCNGFSAANFSSIRSELIASKYIKGSELTEEEILTIMDDILPADIAEVRRYQELQALLNCTRKSLLPKTIQDNGNIIEQRKNWLVEIKELEANGIK